MRSNVRALLCVLPAATMLAACSVQADRGADRRIDDLRGLVLEQRRAIDELRREQESLRAAVDQMQYGRRPGGRPVYGPGGATPSADDSYWRRPIVPGGEPSSYPTMPGDAPAAGAPTGAPSGGTSAPAASGAEPEKGPVPADLVGSTYDSAMRQLSNGDHDDAIQSFRNFLHENAASAYADDAQFWIGEAYFRKGQYHRAIIEFNQVSINYGSGDRAPAALLRQAEAFRIVGDRVDARLSLQKIINRYPGTAEAAKASRMLAEIGG